MEVNNIGHNVRMLRTYYNLTATQLSIELNLVTARISEIEKRKNIRIKPEETLELAQYFNVPVEDLIYKKAEIIFK